MALTYDDITSITKKYYLQKLPWLAFKRNFLQMRLAKRGTKPQSGSTIMQPIPFTNTKGGFFSPYDTFDVNAEQQITAAEFTWRYGEVPITISRDEILKNQGPEGVKKLLDTKVTFAAKRMSDMLAVSMFGTGNDSSTGLNSLDNLLNDGSNTLTPAGATAGGISKTTYSWWEGSLQDCSAGALTTALMGSGWFQATDGSDQPTIVVGHNNAVNKIWSSLSAVQRYVKADVADLGFLGIEFNGKPFVADTHVADSSTAATNRLYMINEDYIDFVTHAKENMRMEPFQKIHNQAVIVAHVMWAGNLTVSYPAMHCVLHNFTR